MAVSYKKLWKLLIDKDMKKKDLHIATGMTTTALAKLGKNEHIIALANLILAEFEAKQKPQDKQILAEMKKGHTQKEIASILGMKQPTVSRHIGKMRKEFRKG